ncbi:MAG: hypothetical protein LR015_01685 [Verrucomicrobia bacterium]|nr:hypothetical protein [Verrucomicrobiota bacterium]
MSAALAVKEIVRPHAKYPVLLREERDEVKHTWVANQLLLTMRSGAERVGLELALANEADLELRWLNATTAVVSWGSASAQTFFRDAIAPGREAD